MKKLICIVLLFSIGSVHSQSDAIENSIKSTINTFFKGLHTGDTAIINSVINEKLKLQTTGFDDEGNSVLRTQTKE